MNTQNTHGSSNDPNADGSGGPTIAIVLGVLIIIGAVVLVMTLGQNEVNQATGEKLPPKVAADGHDHGDHDHEHGDGHDHDHEETPKTELAPGTPAKAEPKADEKPAAAPAPAAPGAPAAGDDLGSAKAFAEKGFAAPIEGTTELPIELPNPAFAGTPKQPPKGVKMKPLTGRDRGPYRLPQELVGELTNLAYEKPVTSSDSAPIIGDLEQATDGDKEPLDGRWVELAPGKQWIQVDLGAESENFAIVVWHNHLENNRVYRDVVVQVSNDPDFVDAKTVFNNDYDNSSGFGEGQDFEYFENYEGLLVPLYNPDTKQGQKFRYVRCWSKGSTSDDANHYAELEVWGREPK